MTTKRWKQFMVGLATTAILAALTPTADAGLSVRRLTRAQRMETSQEAAASLTAVGAASGWGRIKVEDTIRQGMTKREVEVDLFDMEPMTGFQVEADGIFLGTITTDASGWGSLKLETDDDSHPPVPAELPPAGELVSASIRDASDAFVLEGSFVGFAPDEDDDTTVHEEKISLDDVSGIGAAGVAKVEREADGTQEFDTRATGLTPGAIYTIMVDGVVAGMATADPVGQARLELEAPDDEDPLPTDLQPVEDLRVVEWVDEAGTVVLAGLFTGVSNDDDDDDNGSGSGSGSDDGNGNGNGDDDGDDDGNGNGSDDGSGSDDGGGTGDPGGGNGGPGSGGDD